MNLNVDSPTVPDSWCRCGNPTGPHRHPTSEDVIQKMHTDNAFELRMWKEGFAEGFKLGHDIGYEEGRDRN